MIRDHRPYFIKKLYLNFQQFYTRRYIRPQLESLGTYPTFMKPWHVEIFGAPIRIGNFVTVIAAADMKTRLSVWSDRTHSGQITIGDYVMLCPGTRINLYVNGYPRRVTGMSSKLKPKMEASYCVAITG